MDQDVVTVYVDGSYLPETEFGSSACWCPELVSLSLSQYYNATFGPVCAFNAELYAAILAVAQAFVKNVKRLQLKQDCITVVQTLSAIDPKKGFAVPTHVFEKIERSYSDFKREQVSTSLLEIFWYLAQHVEVKLVHIYGHAISPSDTTLIHLLYSDEKRQFREQFTKDCNLQKLPKVALTEQDFTSSHRVDKMAKLIISELRRDRVSCCTVKDRTNPLRPLLALYNRTRFESSVPCDVALPTKVLIRNGSFMFSRLSSDEISMTEYLVFLESSRVMAVLSSCKDRKRCEDIIHDLPEELLVYLWRFKMYRDLLLVKSNSMYPLFTKRKQKCLKKNPLDIGKIPSKEL